MSMATNFGRVGIYNDEFPSKNHQKYFSCCITTTAKPIATKLVGDLPLNLLETYYKKPQPVKSHSPLNMWSCGVM